MQATQQTPNENVRAKLGLCSLDPVLWEEMLASFFNYCFVLSCLSDVPLSYLIPIVWISSILSTCQLLVFMYTVGVIRMFYLR